MSDERKGEVTFWREEGWWRIRIIGPDWVMRELAHQLSYNHQHLQPVGSPIENAIDFYQVPSIKESVLETVDLLLPTEQEKWDRVAPYISRALGKHLAKGL